MIIGLREKLEAYAVSIKVQYPDYVAIYKYFEEYLNSQPQYHNLNLHDLSNELRKMDIVNSCRFYVENSNASSKTAIAKYLNALSKLYRDIIDPFGNDTLARSMPFSRLAKEVEKGLAKNLDDGRSSPAISQKEFDLISDYFECHTQKRFTQLQVEIIFKLILLYGFKFERIQKMSKANFDLEWNELIIDTSSLGNVKLKMPRQLVRQLQSYFTSPEYFDGPTVFCNTMGNPITPAFLNYAFRKIEKINNHKSKAFCSTGLAKFAIIKLIDQKINLVTIKEITGMEDALIADCTKIYFNQYNTDTQATDIDKINTYREWDQ